ncbi:MAG: ATP-binding protein [Planctomycetota bacterium]|nr:ATP-binding protein [Planctomycetota bacterium]
MTIVRKLKLTALLPIVIALLMGLVLVPDIRLTRQFEHTVNVVEEITKGVFELNMLTYEYLERGEARARSQWNLLHGSLSRVLDGAKANEEDQRDLLSRIKSNLAGLNTDFGHLTDGLQNLVPEDSDNSLAAERIERLRAQMLMKSQAMVSDAKRLSELSQQQFTAAKNRAFGRIAFAMVMLIVGLAVATGWIGRSIGLPIQQLRLGAETVAAGDLDHQVEIKTRDEVGELAHAFNGMATNLQAMIERHRTAEEEVSRNAAVLKAINEVFGRTLTCDTEEELGKTCLSVAEELTGSKFGFFGEVNEDGLFDTIAISNPGWDACDMAVEDALSNTVSMPIRGIDRSTIREGKPRIVNEDEFQTHPDRVGFPEGHPPVRAFLGVPFIHEEKVVGMIGLGNKEGGYDLHDQEAVEALSVAMVEALRNKRSEVELAQHREHLEEMVAERTQELARSNTELEQFAYVASHDLQEPLRMVASYTQLLADSYQDQLDEDANEFIGYAVDGARRMQDLISDLLAYSRVTRGETELKEVSCDAALDNALTNLEGAVLESRALIIRQELPPVKGDTTQLTQLFQNLIGNAVKYRGEVDPVIEIGVEENGSQWQFSVKDNGIGIDKKFSEKVFEIFQRLHGRTEYAGTGIGLSLCKRIVEKHGGNIWFESEPGKGSNFIFTMPKVP